MGVKSEGEYMKGENEELDKLEGLQFTGNWFIDAGILGFVNLMEEVYGWDLEELQRRISRSENTYVYSLFTYAFWYKILKETVKRWLEKDIFKNKEIKKEGLEPEYIKENIKNELLFKIERENQSNREKVLEGNLQNNTVNNIIISFNKFIKKLVEDKFSKYESKLKKVFSQNKKTIVTHTRSVGMIAYLDFFTNLGFFNPSSNRAGKENEILSLFEKLIFEGFVRKDKKIKNLPSDVFDKSLSPFIYSASDFPNEYYGSPMTLKILKNISINPVIYILCIPFSFLWVSGKNYLFYTPDLMFTYYVNKKLSKYIENISESRNIYKITWDAVIDTLIELKSQHSLENMYLLEFSGIRNQQLQDVEYLSISKLQATILLDDTLRDAINANIPIKVSNRRIEEGIWLLEEFIKKKPLLPYLIRNVHLYLAENNFLSSRRTLVYASIIDAKIREFGIDNRLFGDYFFDKYRQLLAEIKDDSRRAFGVAKTIKELIGNLDERKKHANILLKTVRRKDKYRFVNSLLKVLIEKKVDKENIKKLNNFIFSRILPNDLSWRNYALIFVIGLIAGGESDGSS